MTEASYPPTVVIMHRTEKRSKCTVWPLRERADFEFYNFPRKESVPVEGYVRLGLEGPALSTADAGRGLLVLDATWRHVEAMEAAYAEVPTRSLPPLITAYPRVSKLFKDPSGGLATIEAVYAAYAVMGRPTEGLLDHYHWRSEFLDLNKASLARA